MLVQAAGQRWEAILEATGLAADNGVPSRVDIQKPYMTAQAQNVGVNSRGV